jgi:1-acyl-sn-glycerol-3-phosphate acyltransferase
MVKKERIWRDDAVLTSGSKPPDEVATPVAADSLSLGGSGLYRFCRSILRFWFSLNFRRVRVLQAEALADAGATLLVVNHPSSFLDTLLLIAALRRQVHCLLERGFLRGPARRLLARSLGVIEFEFHDERWPSVVDAAYNALSRGGTVVVFAKQQISTSEEPATFAPAAAAIALKALSGMTHLRPLAVRAVHLFLPVSRSQSGELLIQIDEPLALGELAALAAGTDAGRLDKALDSELERTCRQNPFRLQPEALEQFLAGVEIVAREDFEDRWERRPNSRQRVEDFELSPFLIRLVAQLNYSHPGRLVGLGEGLQAYKEMQRRSSLAGIRAEIAGRWLASGWQKTAVWIETVIGLPVALYGMINLLIAWPLLHALGLLRRGLWNATTPEWTARVMVTLICYGGQIVLAAYFLPRSLAGYYAPSLPISGAYLLRYFWLLENRTNIVVLSLDKERRQRSLRKLRNNLLDEIRRDQDRFAALWKIAH